jgi:hypothetical protein
MDKWTRGELSGGTWLKIRATTAEKHQKEKEQF